MHNSTRKTLGATCLVAGTAIGVGIIALPMSFAKLGIIPSFALVLITWFVMYYTALVNLELNLQAGEGLPLGALGRKFSGHISEVIGSLSLKILSYTLICAYIAAGTSMIFELLVSVSIKTIIISFGIILALVMLMPTRIIDQFNKLLFFSLVVVFALLSIVIISNINTEAIPWMHGAYYNISSWSIVIPVTFTSFGFQVIFHTLTNYCDKNPTVLRRAFFWGSLIPVIVYTMWTFGVLSLLHGTLEDFYQQIVSDDVPVGALIGKLGVIINWEYFKLCVWLLAFLATVTSLLGVSMGLVDSMMTYITRITIISNHNIQKGIAVCTTITPPLLIVACTPNVFVQMLGFAGLILVVIAILMPTYLLYKISSNGRAKLFYPILKNTALHIIAITFATLVIVCEIARILLL